MRINATIVSVVLSKANWLEKIRPKSPFPILTISKALRWGPNVVTSNVTRDTAKDIGAFSYRPMIQSFSLLNTCNEESIEK
mmetsp:Transcript_26555/g.28963  ORF Transcript_26555/g.28963 Transcript_26555/m.28963 type:complete len:81 (+) Transcript_26555:725-967(+)